MLIKDLLNHIETFAPLALALDWDNVGLLLGDRAATVNKALVTLDVTPTAVDKAIERGCDLIVSHHPLIFRPLKSLTDPLLLKLAARGIAVICLHTNLDVAPYGVNHALADALGLQVTGRLSLETGNRWQHISVTVPPAKAEDVARAAFAAGAGRIGNYGSCSTRHPITGTFLPGQGAHPQLEQPDPQGLSRVEEVELEFMADSLCLPQVLQAIRAAHPYETPALYHFPVANANPAYGLGLLGEFVPRLSLGEIRELVSDKLDCPAPRIWTAGLDLAAPVGTVAICGGSGGSLLNDAQRQAELFISGDLSYHSLLDSRIPLIDAGHFHTEYPVLGYLQKQLRSQGLEAVILPREEHEYSRFCF